ncbi:MAG: serine/threonine-protein kinase [Myxococcales bacterium]|nr:serine/threonine protein kinase [Myxococcota bacterium]MDW8280341.1 serine/threonine-protein kinase [Myxococcales bacterium]
MLPQRDSQLQHQPAPSAGTAGRGPLGDSAWRAYRRSQLALYPQRYRLMAVIGVVLISLFYLVDVRYPWPEYVDLGPREFFVIRALWVSCYLVMLATSYYREMDERLQNLRDLILVVLTAAFLGVVCAHTGRLASPYYGGVMLMLLARSLLLPGVLSRTAIICVMLILVWAGFASFWPARLPRPGWQGRHGVEVLANLTFVVSAFGLSLFGAFLADRLALGLETAKLMGRYRLGRRLGAGGMGEVYLAYHASLRRTFAVKILKEELCDGHAVLRFEREAEAASRLRHPNTIAVFDFGRTETGRPYYVMEYLEGCDLRQLVQREGPLHPARAECFLYQAASSLSEAHGLSMVHRDIKPGNLFVTSVGGRGDFIKVLDFGLVKGADLGPEITRTDAIVGTPRYMAPEGLAGQPVDARADVYALGAVAYFMLTGQPPFCSDDPYADIRQQLSEPPPPIMDRRDPLLPVPSAELQAVVMRCLERDPRRRYADATELVAALEQTPEHGRWHPMPRSAVLPGEEMAAAAHDEEGSAETILATRPPG